MEQYRQDFIGEIVALQDRIRQNWEEGELSCEDVIAWVNDYFICGYGLGYFNDSNFRAITKNLKKIECIRELEPEFIEENIFGTTRIGENGLKQIYINPRLSNENMYLDTNVPYELGEETHARTCMYLYRELGHCLAFADQKAFRLFLENNEQAKNSHEIVKNFAKSGVKCLEEIVIQNSAEDIFYDAWDIERPAPKANVNELLFGQSEIGVPNKVVQSRLDFCGELEPAVADFAKTLKGVGSSEFQDNNTLIKDFSCKAFKPTCCRDIVAEYLSKPNGDWALLENLTALGYLINAKYNTLGGRVSEDLPLNFFQDKVLDFYDILKENGEYYKDFSPAPESFQNTYPEYFISKSDSAKQTYSAPEIEAPRSL